jgi:hypothetical protein
MRTYRFAEIESLEILKCRFKGKIWLWLCICTVGRHRLLRCMEFESDAARMADDIQNILMPVAKSIASAVPVPINESFVSVWRTCLIS